MKAGNGKITTEKKNKLNPRNKFETSGICIFCEAG